MKTQPITGAANKLAPLHIHIRDFSVSLNDDYTPTDDDGTDFVQQGRHRPISVSVNEDSEKNSDIDSPDPIYTYHFIYEVATRSLYSGEHDFLADKEGESSEPEVAMEIIAKFDACYVSTKELEPEERDAFAKYNVGFNVWPYWRELVGSVCARIGKTPPIIIPFYKMNNYSEEPNEE